MSPHQKLAVSRTYRFLRRLVRVGLRLRFRKLRLLRSERLPDSANVVFVVSHPASFLDALVLVAVFERQVRCLLSQNLFAGLLSKWLARGLGMIADDAAEGDAPSVLSRACEAVARGEAVAMFSEPQTQKAEKHSSRALTAASIALEAGSRQSAQFGLFRVVIFPVHMFVPVPQSESHEALIYLGDPLDPQREPATKGAVSDRREALAAALQEKLREGVFSLRPEQVQQFLHDLEEALRVDLEEDWASRSNWKQTLEGFELSDVVREWAERLNDSHPERLVALRSSVEAWREARRLWSLRELEVETAGTWRASAWRGLVLAVLRAIGEPSKLRRMRQELLQELNRSVALYTQPESPTVPSAHGGVGVPSAPDV